MVNLDEVLTFSEAAEKWGLADGKSVRKAVERNKFEDHEIKKSGNVWLTTYDAMYRVFGEPRETPVVLSIFDLFNFNHRNITSAIDTFFQRAQKAIQEGQMVSIVENKNHPERIFCILKNEEELVNWRRRMKYYLYTSSLPDEDDKD